MSTSSIRGAVVAIGVVPLVLIALGLFGKTKWSRPLLIIGGLWAIASVLFTVREVSATVTAEDPTITYKGVGEP